MEETTQKQLVKVVSQMTGHSMAKVDEILKAFNEAIRNEIFNKREVKLPYIGKFYLKKLKAGVHSTPQGHIVYKGERYAPKMKFTQAFKAQIKKIHVDAEPTPDNDLPFEE